MRITQNTIYTPYERTLNDIQQRKYNDQMKISSGNAVQSLSDDPTSVVNSKQLTSIIDRNVKYQNNIDTAVQEIQASSDQIDAMGNSLADLRQIAVEATSTGNYPTLYSLGDSVKGILQDLVKNASTDFNGQYLFSGTLTTASSIATTSRSQNTDPFEITTQRASSDNPSGLKVVFKGNNEDREINSGDHSTEQINAKASDIFGGDGDDLFSAVVNLYNVITYNSDGTTRTENSPFTSDDMTKLNDAQSKIATLADQMNQAGAKLGSKLNRFQSISDQITQTNTKLKDFRSTQQDTDMAQASIDLAKDDNALQYALKVGSYISQQSLFDFLQ
jgi:flagellin-like hook-associated protein FlgL